MPVSCGTGSDEAGRFTKGDLTATAALSVDEQQQLADLEEVIEGGLPTFVAVGKALLTIRDRRLYRARHATFEDYCRTRWAMSRRHANRLIEASEVVETMGPMGPTKERHARELIPLDPEARRYVWQLVQTTAPEGEVTAAHVRSVTAVAKQLIDADALDDGTGQMVSFSDPDLAPERRRAILEANLTEETFERYQRQREYNRRAIHSSAGVEWYTPSRFVEAAREVLDGIDLNPASCEQANGTVKAARFYDVDADGLAHDWPGAVFLNPPYCQQAGVFVEHLVNQYEQGITTAAIVVLSSHSIDNLWFRPLWRYPIAFAGRVHFDSPAGPTTAANHGTVFAYLGPNVDRFDEVFGNLCFAIAQNIRTPRPQQEKDPCGEG